MTKWQLFLQIDQSFQIHRSYGSMLEGEADELKRVFLEGNLYLLVITMIVSVFHSIFNFLAFKNDIQFWNKNKSMDGLSAKSVIVSFSCQLICKVGYYGFFYHNLTPEELTRVHEYNFDHPGEFCIWNLMIAFFGIARFLT
ncbi:CLPTM1-like membrane protein cnrB isoform X1 [Camellia sinensis]|uniref:CLPTM1-like membrane protein cnrB isoform X1 n=2 Tax=Camellia sinensis TaxID=4442 RepID=UPI0010369B1B|nr:CLPTM1-like membrane protein cnrB isoform X1 [Camellia sinensis]